MCISPSSEDDANDDDDDDDGRRVNGLFQFAHEQCIPSIYMGFTRGPCHLNGELRTKPMNLHNSVRVCVFGIILALVYWIS